MAISRKRFVKAVLLLPAILKNPFTFSIGPDSGRKNSFRRVRPGDPAWPKESDWAELGKEVNGHLIKIESPMVA